jgi:ABC-2 type transport system permease protein
MTPTTFITLLKRESWEHRSLFWVPLVTATLIVLTAIISTNVAGSINVELDGDDVNFFATLSQDGRAQAELFGVWMSSLIIPIIAVTLVVLFFYLLDSLYAERKDRSILFWKSLPVSDGATVLSKAAMALVAVPLWVWLLSLVTGLLVFAIVAVKVSGSPIAPLGNFHFGTWIVLQLTLLQNLFIASLWYAPIAAYLLLVSVWAKRAPFLWAVLPPALLIFFEKIAFDSSYVAKVVGRRLSGYFEAIGPSMRIDTDEAGTATLIDSIRQAYEGLSAASLLAEPAIYLGLAVAAIMVFVSIRLRRWRDDA